MKILNTKFKGLKVIKLNNYKDIRGNLKVTYNEKNINFTKFVFDYCTTTKGKIVRGFHFQYKYQQAKYVSVIKGKILDCVIDLRKNSKTFGKSYKIILSDKNNLGLYIPEGFAHGFGGLDKENIIAYSCTNYRFKRGERGLLWNDKNLKINWGIKKPILSAKDKDNLTLKEFLKG